MKRVVVASGKGGTGKTTVSAVFARLASASWKVTVADADVEASNLPIALKVTDASCSAFQGGRKAYIVPERCDGCGACIASCRFGAIGYGDGGTVHVDALVCEGCGRCVAVCPHAAIQSAAASAGEACSGTSVVGPIAYGQLGPGEDLSGRLVTEVRLRANNAAEEDGSDLVVIDGPPGVGCPLIAAVANTDALVAVAEPTVSGAHDLNRLVDLAQRLALPVYVVLNKADLSDEGACHIRELCTARHLPILAEVPFDPALGAHIERIASAGADDAAVTSPGFSTIAQAWTRLERTLEL